jgi:putative restriction endonuclease
MKLYVGITDSDWFRFLRARNAEEMNFWRPGGNTNFGAISPGELFLFKTRFPDNRIVGGAYYVRHTSLPLHLAWEVFKEANGVQSHQSFQQKISSIRKDDERNPVIGCTVLTQPFYFSDEDTLPPPLDWSQNIVTGKSYDAQTGEGARLYESVKLALARQVGGDRLSGMVLQEQPSRYGSEQLVKPRLGQGGFRVVVMESYGRRCAITGEKTLPVLEAAHIQPFSDDGPHTISNGVFLRSDFHTLFDRGYITITNEHRVEVSKRIREEFSNGKEYYAFHGKELQFKPKQSEECPAREYLEWHQNHRFLNS